MSIVAVEFGGFEDADDVVAGVVEDPVSVEEEGLVSEVKCWAWVFVLTGFSARQTIGLVLAGVPAGGFHLHGDILGMEERHR